MISFKHLLIFNVSYLLISGFCSGYLFYSAENYRDSSNNIAHEALIAKVKSSEDVDWLKNGMLLIFEQRNAYQADVANSYNDFGELLFAFMLLPALNIALLYKLRKQYSNNSSNLTGAENAPPS